jgi:hypothetical protein
MLKTVNLKINNNYKPKNVQFAQIKLVKNFHLYTIFKTARVF